MSSLIVKAILDLPMQFNYKDSLAEKKDFSG